jgi:hypothetical protein
MRGLVLPIVHRSPLLSRITRPEVATTPHRPRSRPLPPVDRLGQEGPSRAIVTIGCRVLSTATSLSSPCVDAVAYIESPAITYPELHRVCKLLWMFTARRSMTCCKS